MYCPKCGKKIRSGANACPFCGTSVKNRKIEKAKSEERISLKCSACGGQMEYDAAQGFFVCRYCGTKEASPDHAVREAEKARAASKERLEKLRREQHEKEECARNFRREKLRIVSVILMVFDALMLVGGNSPAFTAAIILQFVLFLLYWLFGKQIIPCGNHRLYRVFAIAGLIMAIPVLGLITGEDSNYQRISWPTAGPGAMLPAAPSTWGHINSTETAFYADLGKMSEQQCLDYRKACKELGFMIEPAESDNGYDAFNQDGYKLELYRFKSDGTFNIILRAPVKLGVLNWPHLADKYNVPQPESTLGSIDWESNDGFNVYVGDTDREAYSAYVNSCIEAGYTVGYSRSGDSFSGKNGQGCSLSADFEGFGVMRVMLKLQDGQ